MACLHQNILMKGCLHDQWGQQHKSDRQRQDITGRIKESAVTVFSFYNYSIQMAPLATQT